MVGFQAEPVGLAVQSAAGADERAVQQVAGVELQAGLGAVHVHCPAADRLQDARGKDQVAGRRVVEDIIQVVAAAGDEQRVHICTSIFYGNMRLCSQLILNDDWIHQNTIFLRRCSKRKKTCY